VRVISAPDLPAGWFGKQWACQVGAANASGTLLLFSDADTRHAPDLITRLVAARASRDAELMSVAGRQDMHTLWEWAVQPSVFALILLRYGGTTSLEQARQVSDVIANGQCFMISREGYDAIGQHAAVKGFVAEDLMIAQAVWRSGRRVSLMRGVHQLSTRMYDSLPALMRGWGKNVYAGGRFAMRGGAVGRALYPLLLPLFPLALLLPFVTLLAALIATLSGSVSAQPWLLWSSIASLGVLWTFAMANRLNVDPIYRACLAPLGAAVLLAICLTAVVRGRKVEWKGRDYVAE
jgi:chlorobactene glucosyltransferase